ncbi:MAG: lipocalin family protein [Lachnospiraceae bacterium]|nr:lipocalin family protein [Lachnospiraceae bacterium]
MRKMFNKIIPVILICAFSVMTFAGCSCSSSNSISAEAYKAMEGTWNLVAARIDNHDMKAEEIGTVQTLVFDDDGKVKYTVDGKSEEYTWDKKGEFVNIHVPESDKHTATHIAIVEGNSLLLLWNHNGKSMQLLFSK